jgi:hypothetical protein
LHVLSAPPAFVLSQDQTLREENVRPSQSREASALEEHTAERPSNMRRNSSDQFELDARSSSSPNRDVSVPEDTDERQIKQRSTDSFLTQAHARERSRRFTLLSFQRPRRVAATKSL